MARGARDGVTPEGGAGASGASGAVEAIWRIEGSRIVATVARMTGDLGLAEDVAQDAVAEALASWPRDGVPANPAAWLTAVAKRRAIDAWRRAGRLEDRVAALGRELEDAADDEWQPIDDDLLRLVFTACHPVLSRESQVALTLRVVATLGTPEIARLLLTSVPTVQARITRAKAALAAAGVAFEVPDPAEWGPRLSSVMAVVSLLFTEGYAASTGERWMRPELADEALRLGRVLAALVPREPEPLALVALMELQRSRFAARESRTGEPVLLADQDRRRWDHAQIARGANALARADALAAARGVERGAYSLQAAIARCHSVAVSVEGTDWAEIVGLYASLQQRAPSPIVELNRAVAVSMADGPAAGLALVDALDATGALSGSPLIPSVRGELLSRLGRTTEAAAALAIAAERTVAVRQRDVLLAKAAALR